MARVLTDLLDEFIAQGRMSGGAVGIAGCDGPLLRHAFGDVGGSGSPRPARVDDRYLLTSITKQFTVAQVLQLVERGLVDLESPIAAYVPEFAVNGKERVTTRHLLTHTSGLDLTSNTTEALVSDLEAAGHLKSALGANLSWEPGTWFEYCSVAYWVLAELVTRISGVDYVEHLRRGVLEPLSMMDTKYEPERQLPERYVSPRGRGEIRSERVRRLAYPAGGLVGTVDDLLRFGRCLLGDGALDGARVLSPATVRALRRVWVRPTYMGRQSAWGLGWQHGGPGDLQSDDCLFQWGGSGTGMWVDLDQGLVLVLLTPDGMDWQAYSQVANAAFSEASRPNSG